MQKEKATFQVIPNWLRTDWNQSKKLHCARSKRRRFFAALGASATAAPTAIAAARECPGCAPRFCNRVISTSQTSNVEPTAIANARHGAGHGFLTR
jgi:hypothetical protein